MPSKGTPKKGRARKKNGQKENNSISPLKAFIAFFLVFAIVGYIRGRSVRYSPERLRMDLLVYNRDRFRLNKDPARNMILVYECPSDRFWYEIDSDQLHRESDGAVLPEGMTSIEPAILSDATVVGAFLSGAASVWTVKEVFTYLGGSSQVPASSRIKIVVAAILGTVIGYEIGYQIAVSVNPSCNNSEYAKLLLNKEEWKDIVAALWREEYGRVKKLNVLAGCESGYEETDRIQDKRMNEARLRLQQHYEREVSNIDHLFSSKDFEALYEFEKVRDEFRTICGG